MIKELKNNNKIMIIVSIYKNYNIKEKWMKKILLENNYSKNKVIN